MNLFIGTSARDAVIKEYGKECIELITTLAKTEGINLVFGVYDKGLMKSCYDAFKKEGKRIIGVAPKIYESDFLKTPCNEEIITSSSISRMEKIHEKSDAFLFLPGGVGTYSELFSCLEEKKSNPTKPIFLFNTKFFFSPMLEEMYKKYKEGLLDQSLGELIFISNDIEEMINKIKECV